MLKYNIIFSVTALGWVSNEYPFADPCPSPGILNTKKHTFRKLHLFTSSCEERETPTLLGRLERANLNLANRVGVSLPHERMESDPVSEKLWLLVFRIPDDGHSPETQ
jgi:hypothetical protein